MRIIIERSNLLKSLSHVHRVVERRNTIPILSNVLLKTENEGLRLKATDLDLEITETVAAQSEQPGRPPCRRISSTTSSGSCPTAPR